MTKSGNGDRGQRPCAACKHRRKDNCEPRCVFRQNFPAEKEREFGLVVKIFGVMSLKRMMKSVGTLEERDQVAESIEWEAKAWTDDPIHGPYGQFKRLEQQLEEQRENSNTHRQHNPRVEVLQNDRQYEPQVAECNAGPTIEDGNTSPVMGSYFSTSPQLSLETWDELLSNYYLNTIGGPDSQIGLFETPSPGGWTQHNRDQSMPFINDCEGFRAEQSHLSSTSNVQRSGSQASFYTSPTIGTDFNVNNTGNHNGTYIHQLNSMNPQTAKPDQSRAENKLRRTEDTRDNHHARFP